MYDSLSKQQWEQSLQYAVWWLILFDVNGVGQPLKMMTVKI